jgi:hypothetical protein
MLSGIELVSLEVLGRLPLERARALVPAELKLRRVEGAAEVGLLCFRMQGLAPGIVRRWGLDYSEALWRIGIEWRGEPAWFGACCDIDAAGVRWGGRWLMRYPVRRADIDIDESRARVVRGGNELVLTFRKLGVAPEPTPPRPLVVSDRGRLYRVPWREDPAPECSTAQVEILDDSLVRATWAAVTWQPSGLVHQGRGHHCGIAERLS